MDMAKMFALTGLIYESALVGDWRPALELLDAATGCENVVLLTADSNGHHQPVTSRNELIEARYVAEYAQFNNVWPILASQPVGLPVLDRQIFDIAEYERGVFHNEFAKPNALISVGGVLVSRTKQHAIGLMIYHAKRTAALERRALDSLALVLPHFQRALQLKTFQASLARHDFLLWSISDMLGTAIVIVNDRGAVLDANQAGEGLLRRDNTLLDTSEGRHGTLAPGIVALLRQLGLAPVARSPARDELPLRHQIGPYAITIMPLPGPPLWLGTARTCYAVSITDIAAVPAGTISALRSLFSLTRAEADVVVLLGGHKALKDVSDALGIKLNTTKTLLARAMTKMAVHSQSQVVQIVERLAAGCGQIATEPSNVVVVS